MPWNLVRLIALLTDLPLELSTNATIIDMGSGPLTMPLALYCAKPVLRQLPLRFVCVDRSPRILEAGKMLLELVAVRTEGSLPPWQLQLLHERFGEPLSEKADLFCAINVFNEFSGTRRGRFLRM